MDKLGVSLAHLESKCTNIYDAAEVERVYYPEIEKLLLEFFPDATDALVYNHDVFDKDYQGDRTEDQDGENPGVNANYSDDPAGDGGAGARRSPRRAPDASDRYPPRCAAPAPRRLSQYRLPRLCRGGARLCEID